MSKEVPSRRLLIVAVLGALLLSMWISSCSGSRTVATATPTKTARLQAMASPLPPTPTSPPSATPTPAATNTPTATPTATATATPVSPYERPTDVNPLTGLQVTDPSTLARRPLLVVVNNSPIARPQYGLIDADLVYEYIMEGRSVTRFTALYLARESEHIGPVRSARLANFYLAPQYGGGLVASGAGNDARWWFKNKMGVPYLDIDLDDPSNKVYIWTIGTHYETRMHTSTELLRKWLAKLNKEQTESPLRGFAFSEDAPQGEPGGSATVSFPAAVVWTYDAASGRYLRNMGGVPHKDAASSQQLGAANVIIQTVPHEKTTWVEDPQGNTSIRIITVGEGPVVVLRDGVAIKGTWKAGDTGTPEFFDQDGKIISLKPGNSWFELVGATDKVTIK